ncbi:MAG: hypothetical protein ABH950_07665 [Candidatus Altiarchaeota archaeon]
MAEVVWFVAGAIAAICFAAIFHGVRVMRSFRARRGVVEVMPWDRDARITPRMVSK